MAILGLQDSDTLATEVSTNVHRRNLLHLFPNGAAPLNAIMSMLESEPTDSPVYRWGEDRIKRDTYQLGVTSGSGLSPTGGDVFYTTTQNFTAGQVIRLRLKDNQTDRMQVGQILSVHNAKNGATNWHVVNLNGRITSIPAHNKVEIALVMAYNGVVAASVTTNYVENLGFAAEEAGRDVKGITKFPIEVENYTQIFKTGVGPISGTAAMTPLKYDRTGVYKRMARQAMLDHMIDMEYAFLFGRPSKRTTTNADGDTVPVRTTGGVLWYLEQFELGTTGLYDYPVTPVDMTATDPDLDPNKRMFINPTGTMTGTKFNKMIQQVFRRSNSKSSERLCLCGAGSISAINDFFEGKTTIYKRYPAEERFGMNVTSYESPHGTIHYYSHPLLTDHPLHQFTQLYLDVHNLRYRPMNGRDTKLKKMVQDRNADYRKDLYMTEAGLEVWFPESHLVAFNVGEIA